MAKRVFTAEHRAKLGAGKLGIPKTESHRRHISEALIGKKSTVRRAVIIDGIEYISIKEAADKTNQPYLRVVGRLKNDNFSDYQYKEER